MFLKRTYACNSKRGESRFEQKAYCVLAENIFMFSFALFK